ncbi:MAG TPA: hypothetical protein DD381_01720 [Lentisphaeria bacterium]|nr:MAG: hypothetical protein A2X47_10310 [Lentisphaerae bacterium GWF2_38_69]HBM15060.1 hypothetical protein [Lentisphaeria bacterium]
MPIPEINKDKAFKLPTHIWSKECFACGTENSHGLHMHFYADDKYLWSEIELRDCYKGWDQVIHGGILSTILDEIMAWAAIYMTKNIILTKSMTTDYHEKVLTNSKVRAFAWIEETGHNTIIMKSELYNDKNTLCTSATGHYALFPLKLAKRLHLMSEESLLSFDKFLEACNNG